MKNDDSNEQLKESLSAVMDGEADQDELSYVLKNFNDKTVRSVAKRYQLVGDILRKNEVHLVDIDLSERVAKKINQDPDLSTKKSTSVKPFKWVNSVQRYAVAASVVLAVLVGVGMWKHNEPCQTSSYGDKAILLSDASDDSVLPKPVYEQYDRYDDEGPLKNHVIPASIDSQQHAEHVKRSIDNQVLKRFKAYSFDHAQEQEIGMKNMQGMLPFVRAVSFQLY